MDWNSDYRNILLLRFRGLTTTLARVCDQWIENAYAEGLELDENLRILCDDVIQRRRHFNTHFAFEGLLDIVRTLLTDYTETFANFITLCPCPQVTNEIIQLLDNYIGRSSDMSDDLIQSAEQLRENIINSKFHLQKKSVFIIHVFFITF